MAGDDDDVVGDAVGDDKKTSEANFGELVEKTEIWKPEGGGEGDLIKRPEMLGTRQMTCKQNPINYNNDNKNSDNKNIDTNNNSNDNNNNDNNNNNVIKLPPAA